MIVSLVFGAIFKGWSADDAAIRFEQANRLSQKGEFAQAITLYEALAKQGYRSPILFYNLGNCYFRVGALGRAVLNYERALKLDPTDADIQYNLTVARSRLQDERPAPPSMLVSQWWQKLAVSLSAGGWQLAAIVLLWLATGGFSFWLLGQLRHHKKIGFVSGALLLAMSLVCFALSVSRTQLDQHSRRGVVLERQTLLRAAADAQSPAQDTLYEGATIQLLDQIGEWYKIRLYDGTEGWLSGDTFERI